MNLFATRTSGVETGDGRCYAPRAEGLSEVVTAASKLPIGFDRRNFGAIPPRTATATETNAG
jgi:hypothetical protein